MSAARLHGDRLVVVRMSAGSECACQQHGLPDPLARLISRIRTKGVPDAAIEKAKFEGFTTTAVWS